MPKIPSFSEKVPQMKQEVSNVVFWCKFSSVLATLECKKMLFLKINQCRKHPKTVLSERLV